MSGSVGFLWVCWAHPVAVKINGCYDCGMTTATAPAATTDIRDSGNQVIATLTWNDNGDATRWAKVDDGIITEFGDHTVRVRLQNQITGRIREYHFADLVIAWWSLGLSAHTCNGIDGWLVMALMPGTAGRD